MLKIVLLPEPLGPIRPRISPWATLNETLLTAVKPPKRFIRPSTTSTWPSATCSCRSCRPAAAAPASRCCWLFGHTTYDLSSTYWMMTGKARSFWPAIGVALAVELHAEAQHGAALGQVDVERRLAQRLGVDAAVLLDGARQHLGHEQVGVAGGHADMGRPDRRARLHLVELLADHLDHRRQLGIERLLVGQPDRDRVDVEEVVDVLAQAFLQLVVDAVARAVADQRAELQPLLARLAQQQRDVGVVAGVEDDVRPGALELGDQRRQVGRGAE